MTVHSVVGFNPGTDLGTVSITANGVTAQQAFPSFRKPLAQAARPTISDAFESGTLTANDNGIAVTTRIWRNFTTQTVLGSGATLSGSGLGGVWVEYSPDNGTTWSPPIRVYENGMPSMAAMDADDAAIVALVPHAEVTHIAIADGDWTDAATWRGGNVPTHGAFVLIPNGRTVTYDNNERYRLDRIRVDGTLTWALDQSTQMLVETIIGTRGSSIIMGSAGNRLPSQYTATVTISGIDYSSDAILDTDLKPTNFQDTLGWGRGFVSQGIWRIWGAESTTWGFADPFGSGATTLTMRQDVTNWNVGDELILGATRMVYGTPERNLPLNSEDEYVTITAINGRDITFTPATTYRHDNQLVGSTRTDLYPVVAKRGGKNIKIQSEIANDNARRGHTACVHRFCIMDFWDCEFISLGRTDKFYHGGLIDPDAGGDFLRSGLTGLVREPLTNRSNLLSRYAVHAHHLGFDKIDIATVTNCYVEDVPGWGYVHHHCRAKFDNNVCHLFHGAGMVSEQGAEVDSWVGNLSITSTSGQNFPLFVSPKLGTPTHRGGDKQGDTAYRGFGFFFRGRAMRTNRNVAVSCGWGHVYFHRTNTQSIDNLQDVRNPERQYLDLGETGYARAGPQSDPDTMISVNVPIQHNVDNVSIACCGGFFVSKDAPEQGHDANIRIANFLSWGYSHDGIFVEYVGSYLLENIDCVSGNLGSTIGVNTGGNAFQIGMKNIRTEGNNFGLVVDGAATGPYQAGVVNMNDTNDPRYYIIGHETINDSTEINYIPTGLPTTIQDMTRVEPDWDNTTFDLFAEPAETLPLVIGQMDASTLTNIADNSGGAKNDQLGAAPFPNKSWRDEMLPFIRNHPLNHGRNFGYYTNGGNNVITFPTLFSDRVTARPGKKMHWVETTDTALMSNLGAIDYTATPVTVANPNLTITVPVSGSVVTNVITAAVPAGGDGSTYTLDGTDWTSPNHGDATWDAGTGEVTYRPDAGYSGTDFLYIFIRSASQYRVVRIDYLIGSTGSGLTTPVVNTHFSAAGGGGQGIDITLSDPPDMDARRIVLTQYSTDGGTTWRRLCHKWVQDTHNITVASDGTAITAGSYNVRLRCKTDYDWGFTSASADDPVTVA